MSKLILFIDTNIIIDVLADRQPYSNSAYILFKEAKFSRWKLITSTNSILTAFYILEKQLNSKEANAAIETILSRVDVQDLTKKDLLVALKFKTEDLEDASQIQCANKIGKVNYIITRNKKGFANSIIDVLTPGELLALHHTSR